MNVIKYPCREEWDELLRRPVMNVDTLREVVRTVLDDVRKGGDESVKMYERKFDKVELDCLAVSDAEMEEAERQVSEELKDALRLAHDNIEKFHAAQRFETRKVEVCPGVTCWQKAVPIEKVGLYIPGGTAPLFSTVLMLATPAKIAGCREIRALHPSGKRREGASSHSLRRPHSRGEPYLQGRRRTGDRCNGLRYAKHT